MQSRRFLVTGGSGFIGAALVRRLVAGGARVRVLDNNSRGNVRRLVDVLPDIEFLEGDICDPAVVSEAMRGIDCVWHLAYVNGTRYFYERPDEVLTVGVKGMINVLDGARAHGVRECILASSSEVYHRPAEVPTGEGVTLSVPDVLNPRYSYSSGKIISEMLALHSGDLFERVMVFRPHNVYGEDMGWEHVIPELTAKLAGLMATNGDEVVPLEIQGDGRQTRSFVHVDDACGALMCLYERGATKNIYHIGTQEEVTIASLAHRIAQALGQAITLIPGPGAPGAPDVRCPDIGKMRALGYEPMISLAQGLPAVVRWYAEHPSPHSLSSPYRYRKAS